ncbi:MAG: hypothetical protein QOF35_1713 [Actinomycetota bacterium]|jgi:nucleotide-binding universal stress UspA family protein|nr:hypothetical protein [Actinomycetota bacterium]
MHTRGRIVVGVDGSAASVEAIRWTIGQAELTGSRILAVIGWQYPTQYGTEFYGEEIDWDEIAASTLHTALIEAGIEDVSGIEQRVVQGHPAEVLIEASRGSDVVVVGSRGHGGFVGMLLGSVTERVLAHACCPVLVVRHGKDP